MKGGMFDISKGLIWIGRTGCKDVCKLKKELVIEDDGPEFKSSTRTYYGICHDV